MRKFNRTEILSAVFALVASLTILMHIGLHQQDGPVASASNYLAQVIYTKMTPTSYQTIPIATGSVTNSAYPVTTTNAKSNTPVNPLVTIPCTPGTVAAPASSDSEKITRMTKILTALGFSTADFSTSGASGANNTTGTGGGGGRTLPCGQSVPIRGVGQCTFKDLTVPGITPGGYVEMSTYWGGCGSDAGNDSNLGSANVNDCQQRARDFVKANEKNWCSACITKALGRCKDNVFSQIGSYSCPSVSPNCPRYPNGCPKWSTPSDASIPAEDLCNATRIGDPNDLPLCYFGPTTPQIVKTGQRRGSGGDLQCQWSCRYTPQRGAVVEAVGTGRVGCGNCYEN